MKHIVLFTLLVLSGIKTNAIDSLRVLDVNAYVAIVGNYHPVAKQADLITQQARAELRIARGGWDPALTSDYASKTYNGSNYYSFFESAVKVPVWYGIEVKAGYDFAYGAYINPESKLPAGGLGYLGIQMPLGSELVFDKKRAALRQAQIFTRASEQEKLSQLNDLYLDALKAYYDWANAFAEYNIYVKAVKVAEERFIATCKTAALGDRPAIDTTEALTQLQSRQLQQVEAKMRYINALLQVNNFLWLPSGEPYPFDSLLVPVLPDTIITEGMLNMGSMETLAMQLKSIHPQLAAYSFKLKQLEIERRLKLESLKPKLNLQYNLLSNRFNFSSPAGSIFTNAYKFGLQFSMPLSFTQARGELTKVKLKIQETGYLFQLKEQQLINKLRSSFNELVSLQQQSHIYLQTTEGYKTLWEGEQKRFINGESSLFLVNSRENKYIEAQLKIAELTCKYYKAEATYKWATGNTR